MYIYIQPTNIGIVVRRDKSFERMTNEHELEGSVKKSFLGGGSLILVPR